MTDHPPACPSCARLEAERDEAQRLSALAVKARDTYDDERRASYQEMCGWKGRAEKVEAERDDARKERDAQMAIVERMRKHELIGPVAECGCASCDLHHKYESTISRLTAQLQEAQAELVRYHADVVAENIAKLQAESQLQAAQQALKDERIRSSGWEMFFHREESKRKAAESQLTALTKNRDREVFDLITKIEQLESQFTALRVALTNVAGNLRAAARIHPGGASGLMKNEAMRAEADRIDAALSASPLPACAGAAISSRVCERGTVGCDVTHALSLPAVADETDEERCHANRDGDCSWEQCPQTRDGEPATTSRDCPLWTAQTGEEAASHERNRCDAEMCVCGHYHCRHSGIWKGCQTACDDCECRTFAASHERKDEP